MKLIVCCVVLVVASSFGVDRAEALQSGLTSSIPSSRPGVASLVAAPCSGSSATTTNFSGSTGPITDFAPGPPVPATFTALVAGQAAYLWDVDLTTAIQHGRCLDLDVTLESPSGTRITITTDNGGTFSNLFNGTLWDDGVNDPVTNKSFTNGVPASPLSPEGRLEAFRGEDPNGIWKLTVTDDQAGSPGGVVSAWSLSLTSLAAAPLESASSSSRAPNLTLPDLATVADVMPVSGLGSYLKKLVLYTEIRHTFAADLDVTLTSPSGTSVVITTDNGVGFNHVFDGTLFDGDALDPVTDHVYANAVVATPLSPEGAFDNFLGQDPNGNWTLTITDDSSSDIGTLERWDLSCTTISAPSFPAPVAVAGTSGNFVDPPVRPASTFTASVSGVGAYLWDLDLTTFIQHPANGELDIRLTSPAGTSVVISTGNGGGIPDVFNGTTWDDSAFNPVTDVLFSSSGTVTPLGPEGRVAAFRGEDPNGLWSLTIDDYVPSNVGALNSWTLGVTTLAAPPLESTTTVSSSPNLLIPAGNSTVSDTLNFPFTGITTTKVVLYVELMHAFPGSLHLRLTGPGGNVAVSTGNGGSAADAFNGTTFDTDVLDPVTDHVFASFTVATALSPEGPFDNFVGTDPGSAQWTLSISNVSSPSSGSLVRWDLAITTCSTPTSPAVVYCTPGTTSNGCLASFDPSTVNPSVSGATNTFLMVNHVEGERNGILFYGLQPNALPWNGSSSTLCVKSPTHRTGTQDSSGTPGQCNGYFALQWETYQLAHPTALGNPWVVGEKAYCQAWFRDPNSPATTNLSDAIELTYGP